MELLSFIGICAALAIIIIGALRGHSLILVSTIAALVCSFTGALASAALNSDVTFLTAFYDGYATSYMQGVANIIISLFPLFLGGQLFGKLLDRSQLPIATASLVFKLTGPKGVITAVFFATLLLVIGGVNVYVIIFTIYPLAAAFYKEAGIPKYLLPANIFAACTTVQVIPGVPVINLILPAEYLNVAPGCYALNAIICSIFNAGLCLIYLNWRAKKFMDAGAGFVDNNGSADEYDLHAEGLPHGALILLPVAIVIILMNAFSVPAWAALFVGCVIVSAMFYKRLGGGKSIVGYLADAAESSQVVLATGAICGLATIIGEVPGYQILLKFLNSISGSDPLILSAIAVALLAGFAGSATGGIQFVLENFSSNLLALGVAPEALTRVIAVSSLTLDSLPHNPAIVLTLQHCGVSQKDGYKYIGICTVLIPIFTTILTIVLLKLGIH